MRNGQRGRYAVRLTGAASGRIIDQFRRVYHLTTKKNPMWLVRIQISLVEGEARE